MPPTTFLGWVLFIIMAFVFGFFAAAGMKAFAKVFG